MAGHLHISHAPTDKDRDVLRRLLPQLSLPAGWTFWHRDLPRVGDSLTEAREGSLRRARACLLMISADFLADPYCQEELERALRRLGAVAVLPLHVRPTDLAAHPLGALQILPVDGLALIGHPRGEEQVLVECMQALRAQILAQPPAQPLAAQEVAAAPATAPNPFFFGGRVMDPHPFFGRGRVVRKLVHAFRRGTAYLLLGERRIGKSSLLWHLATRELIHEAGLLPVYVNLQEMLAPSPAAWLECVLREVAREAPGLAVGHDLRALQCVSRESAARGRPLVLLLDEGERMTDPALGFDEAFLGPLRAMIEARGATFCVACQKSPAERLQRADGTSPWTNVFRSETLGLFEEKEATALLELGAPLLRPADRAWILDQVGRYPGLLQLTAAIVYERRSDGDDDPAGWRAELWSEAAGVVRDLWNHRSPQERDALAALTRGGRPVPEIPAELVRRGLVMPGRGGDHLCGQLLEELVRCSDWGG